MTEEKKPQEQKKEEKPATQEPRKAEAPAKPEVKAQEPKKAEVAAQVPVQGPAQAPEGTKKKNKKISQMDLKEVEEALNLVREKMGRLDSRYAVELLKRKEALIIK